MGAGTILLALLAIPVGIFSFYAYGTLGILMAPSTAEILVRSIVFFLPIMSSVPIAIAVNRGGEALATEIDRDNPLIRCQNPECYELRPAAEWKPLIKSNPKNLKQAIFVMTCPNCHEIVPSGEQTVVRVDRFTRGLPPSLLEKRGEDGI